MFQVSRESLGIHFLRIWSVFHLTIGPLFPSGCGPIFAIILRIFIKITDFDVHSVKLGIVLIFFVFTSFLSLLSEQVLILLSELNHQLLVIIQEWLNQEALIFVGRFNSLLPQLDNLVLLDVVERDIFSLHRFNLSLTLTVVGLC
jgi:hypothetical protein